MSLQYLPHNWFKLAGYGQDTGTTTHYDIHAINTFTDISGQTLSRTTQMDLEANQISIGATYGTSELTPNQTISIGGPSSVYTIGNPEDFRRAIQVRNRVNFGNSTTAAATADKVVSGTTFEAVKGSTLHVKFTTANTAASPTISIGDLSKIPIYVGGVQANGTTNTLRWSANTIISLVYIESGFDTIGERFEYLGSEAARSIVTPEGAGSWYGTSSTGASTAAKTATIANFSLIPGSIVSILFTSSNSANAPTLNINSTGAKAIWFKNAVTSATNKLIWAAGSVITFMFDGSYWRFLSIDKQVSRGVSVTNGVPSGFDSKVVRCYANDFTRQMYFDIRCENTSGTNTNLPANTNLISCSDMSLKPGSYTTAGVIGKGYRYNNTDTAFLDFPVYAYVNTSSSWVLRSPTWQFSAASFSFTATIPYEVLGIA